jgi:hypothetical protein
MGLRWPHPHNRSLGGAVAVSSRGPCCKAAVLLVRIEEEDTANRNLLNW